MLFKIHSGYSWKRHVLVILPLLLIVCIIGITQGFHGEGPRQFFHALRESRPSMTWAMQTVSDYGNVALYAVYAGLAAHAWVTHDQCESRFIVRAVIGAILFAFLLMRFLKEGFGMPRPDYAWPPHPFGFVHGYTSFPSGHTATVVTAALPLALWFKEKSISLALALVIAAMGFSRLWLGVHHPVDIIGGIVVGSLAARFIFQPRPQPNRFGYFSLE